MAPFEDGPEGSYALNDHRRNHGPACRTAIPQRVQPLCRALPSADVSDAPEIRCRNLELILRAAAETGVDEIWVALEPTYRGARRTGLAMTDECHLQAHGRRFGVKGLSRATVPPDPEEETAGVVWSALEGIDRRVFLWNTVPLHTHLPGKPFLLRRHNAAELVASEPITEGLLDLLSPARLVAVGYESSRALRRAGRHHPAGAPARPRRREEVHGTDVGPIALDGATAARLLTARRYVRRHGRTKR